jgi:hypothetical protein
MKERKLLEIKEIEYCLPVMELLGFEYKPADDNS